MSKEKARYFTFLLYPESIPNDWELKLEMLGVPMAISPLHDKDKSNVEGQKYKKEHYHVIYVSKNPVTPESVRLKIKRTLGDKSVAMVQIISTSMENMYLYLTHESKDAVAKNKHKYKRSDIKLINNFDIDRYIIETLKNQLTHEELLRLQGYVEERQMSFGFDKAEYQYRFFFLEEYKTLASPYVFEKNVQGAKSIMLDEMLKNYSERERILFCNIAYMKYYDFSRHKETPINGGQYITDTGDAFEKYNFHRCEDGTVKGFVETKYVGGYDASSRRPQELHIEKIDSAYQSQDEIEKVTVVFCAKNPKKNINTTVIVGWYKNAKVFRNRKEYLGRPYNIESNYHDAVLLPEQKRNKVIPRAKDNMNNVGFGQSNIWYANKVEHQSLVLDVLKYIDQYSKNKLAKDLRRYNAREDIVLNDFINTHHAKKNYQFEYNNDPEMRREPKVLNQGVSVYPRDKQKSINAIVHSQYKCEINPQHETFNKKSDGLPYLEAHHLIPMSQQDEFEYSLDVEENIVALCSNCHNEIHYGEQANVLIKQLYHNRIELLKKKKIDVSLEKLLSYYGY